MALSTGLLFRAAVVILPLAARLPAQVGDRADIDRTAPPAAWKIPAAPLLSAEESARQFELPPGFHVEIVAAEPLVQDPISVSFDERGRAWVLEWPGYDWPLRDTLPGLEKQAAPKSRVVILEDTDGDGRMDKRTVFLDGIAWARGLQLVRDGALILKLPQLVLARDRDGDGVADHEEVLADGLEIPANPGVAQADLLRTLDNWVYGSRFTRRWREDDGKWTSQPYVTMRGQWGLSQDNYGRIYFAANTDHLIGDFVPAHYYTRNPHYGVTGGIDVRLTTDQRVWPHAITAGVNRRAQLRDEDGRLKEFTANTGPCVYRGDQFGPEFVGNVFVGDVAGRLVRRDIITEQDGVLSSANAYDQREFLFSRDERFRPVAIANGPDGALYVVDMHRGIIENYLFVTTYLRQQILQRKLEQPFNGLGRIYRIVRTAQPRDLLPPLTRDNPEACLQRLADPNGFWRDTAQRLLIERGERDVVPTLQAIVLGHEDELARLHALWTLDGLNAVRPAFLQRVLGDASFRVRMAALRVAEPLLADPYVTMRALSLVNDERIEVRRQLVFTAGEGQGPAYEQALVRLLTFDAGQPYVLEAALSGLADRELPFLERLCIQTAWHEETPAYARVLAALGQAITNTGDDEQLGRLVAHVTPDDTLPLWMRLAVLDGIAGARKEHSTRPVELLDRIRKSEEDLVRLRATALQQIWTRITAAATTAGRRLTGPVFERGATLFALCAACHGPEGKGQNGIAPPLEDSKVLAGEPEEVIRSVLFGRNQDRRNPAYPDMPPFTGLGDSDVAAVVSYVRAQFGPKSAPVSAAAVRKVRETRAVPAEPVTTPETTAPLPKP